MKGYIPQDLFNMCVVTAAQVSSIADVSIEASAAELARAYDGSYDDLNLAQEIAEAAEKVTTFMGEFFPLELIGSALTQLQFLIKHYETSGRRKRFRLLKGARFNRERQPLPGKVTRCLADIAIFHLGRINGRFPPAPDGWTL